MATIRIAGERVAAHAARFEPEQHQAALTVAQERFGHALCECVQPPRKLVIRNRAGKRFLATWPDDGPTHDAACPFYDPPSRAESAAFRRTSDGDLVLAAGFGLHEERHSASARQRGGLAEADRAARHGVGLRELLSVLWHEAGLDRWHTGWTRDWSRCVYALRRATEHIQLGRLPLGRALCVVPTFRRDQATELDRQWDDFTAPLFASAGSARRSLALVLGEVKSIDRVAHGGVLHLRHSAARLYLDEARFAAMATDGASADNAPRRICLALIAGTAQRNLRVRQMAWSLASREYLLASSAKECSEIDAAVTAGRDVVRLEHPDPLGAQRAA